MARLGAALLGLIDGPGGVDQTETVSGTGRAGRERAHRWLAVLGKEVLSVFGGHLRVSKKIDSARPTASTIQMINDLVTSAKTVRSTVTRVISAVFDIGVEPAGGSTEGYGL